MLWWTADSCFKAHMNSDVTFVSFVENWFCSAVVFYHTNKFVIHVSVCAYGHLKASLVGLQVPVATILSLTSCGHCLLHALYEPIIHLLYLDWDILKQTDQRNWRRLLRDSLCCWLKYSGYWVTDTWSLKEARRNSGWI